MKLSYTNQMLERLRNKTIPSAEDISDMIYYFCKDIQTETGKTAEQCPVENESQLMRWLPWDGRMMMRMLQKYKSLAEDPDDSERMARMETKLREMDEALERTQKTKELLEEKEKQLRENSQQLEREQARENKLNAELQEMEQKLTDIAQKIADTEQQKQTLSGQLTEQTELLKKHQQEQTELEQTLQARREEEQQHYEVHLRPLEEQIAELKAKAEQLDQQKQEQEAQLYQIREENNKLVLEIAEMDSVTIPEKQNGIRTKQALLDGKRAEISVLETAYQKLQKEYDATTDQLSQMQSKEETLRSVQLPHIQKLYQDAEDRVKQLENEKTATEQTLADIERQIGEAEEALVPLCEKVRERAIVLESKKRSLSSQNQEYERLNQDLERLSQATSEEELNVLIATAQADIERLKSIEKKCREYEQECEQTVQKISAAVLEQTEKRRELDEKRGRYEAIRSSIREIDNQLTPLGTEEYRKRLSEMISRLEQLRKIKSSLTEDLEQICCCLHDVPTQQNSLDTLRSEALLQTLEQAIRGIQDTLKSCIYAAEKV